MTTVFLLVAMYWNESVLSDRTMYVETMVFKTADRCIRNQASNQKELEKKFSHVEVKCLQKEVVPAK